MSTLESRAIEPARAGRNSALVLSLLLPLLLTEGCGPPR